MKLRPGPPDWHAIYRRLMHGKMRLRPWEIRRMTLPEIALALDDDLSKPRPPGGAANMSHAQMVTEAERYRKLSLRERIAEARKG